MADAPFGIIAGQGALPLRIAAAQRAAGGNVFLIGLEGEADTGITDFPHAWCSLGQLARAADLLLAADCKKMVAVGAIKRPNIEKLKFDVGGEWFLQHIANSTSLGDDRLLKGVIAYFAYRGLLICPAEQFLDDLTGPAGQLGKHGATAHQADINHGVEVARTIGALDIGQSVVVNRKLVLAIEGPEGTDNMLRRVAQMPARFLSEAATRSGVLVKLPKPQQDRRIDLPTLGAQTVRLADDAGLAGIVYQAGGVLIDNRAKFIALADTMGLFVLGLDGDDTKQ